MLAKLMKYDIRNMSKILIYFYIITIALAGITRLIHLGSHIHFVFIIEQVFAGCVFAGIGNILVNTFVHIISTFRKSFFKDESYLTHTLPIHKNKLLLSKYLSALLVILASILVIFLSLFIMYYSPEFMISVQAFLSTVVTGTNIPIGVTLALIIAIVFVEICCFISIAFTSIIQGHAENDKKAFKSAICFVAYYFATMVITLIAIAIIFAISGNIDQLTATTLTEPAFLTLLITALVAYIGFAIAFFFISRKLFNRGVNVD
ncbi:MAG: hypothetical protein IKC79_02340 [Clostridia bacterium]|nr:hypothetical protein [Clostridia bacterium]